MELAFFVKREVGEWSLIKLFFPRWQGIYQAWLYGGLRSAAAMSGLGSVETATGSTSWGIPKDAFPGGDVGLVLGYECRWSLLHHIILADLRYATGFIEVSEPNHRHRVLSLFVGYGFNMSADRKKRR